MREFENERWNGCALCKQTNGAGLLAHSLSRSPFPFGSKELPVRDKNCRVLRPQLDRAGPFLLVGGPELNLLFFHLSFDFLYVVFFVSEFVRPIAGALIFFFLVARSAPLSREGVV